MWTCEKCGKKHEDIFDSCWKCLTPKQKRPRRQRQAKATSGKDRNSGKGASRQEETQTLIFSCVTCSTNLRFQLPLMEGLYTCGSCRTGYRAVKATDSPLVFLVLPQLQRNQTHSSSTSNRPRGGVTPQVRAALKIFSLDETATFDQVRQAYREFVKAYHPDKVSHLGADLRKLAETKTKEINSAFEVLETFYSA